MDNRQIRDLIEDVVNDVPDGLACYDAYEQGKCDEERRIYRELMAKFPLAVKPAVVPWEDSKIGDVVEIDGRNVRVNETLKIQGVCRLCCFEDVGGLCGVKTMPMNFICDCHPSGCGVYFTEVKE